MSNSTNLHPPKIKNLTFHSPKTNSKEVIKIKQRFYTVLCMHVIFILQHFSEMSYTVRVACTYLYTTSIMHMNDGKFCANKTFFCMHKV